ncbi:MAG: hypothetical protein ACOC46_04775, partial [Pirellulales bacterium]
MNGREDSALYDATVAWCDRADRAIGAPPGGYAECAELARRGVVLRRRWDRIAPDAPERRRLVRRLPTVQSVAHCRLTEAVDDSGAADAEAVALVVAQLDEDDAYLVALLNDYSHAPEPVAFAVECFRDDLHWLSAQVAVLDGSRSVELLGHVLLEEEALEREVQRWENERSSPLADAEASGAPAVEAEVDAEDDTALGASGAAAAPVASLLGQLRASAQRLRATAVARQVENLLSQPEPSDWQGWFATWQAASRLSMRLDPDLLETGSPGRAAGSPADEAAEEENSAPESPAHVLTPGALVSVAAFRRSAAEAWQACIARLEPKERGTALRQAAEAVSDAGNETLTFLEELSLPGAVRSLEILEDDVATCRQVVRRHGDHELRGQGRPLRREQGAIAGELQERRLAWRMERLFGRRFVAGLERVAHFDDVKDD